MRAFGIEIRDFPASVAAAAIAIAAGAALFPLLAGIEGLADKLLYIPPLWSDALVASRALRIAGLALPVFIEEAAKFLLVLAFVGTVKPRARAASLAIVAIVIFSAVENAAYAAAFPGGAILGRLLWSSPVHLISALAYAIALGRPGRAPIRFRFSTALAFAGAFTWHLVANLVASRNPGSLEGLVMATVSIAFFLALSRAFFGTLLIGGLDHAQRNES